MKALLVANTGGHLKELVHLRPRLPFAEGEDVWVTFDHPQSRSLLAGRRVVFVTESPSRDLGAAARNLAPAIQLLRQERFDVAVSTGAALAASFLPLARLRGVPCHYIESATRIDGPSMTGRIMSFTPGVRLYTQHESWAGERWRHAGSVFDGFTATPDNNRVLRKVVVTLGSSGFSFRRLVERLHTIIPADAEVLWQTGQTDVSGLPVTAVKQMPAHEIEGHMASADLVVAHSGIGSALTTLEMGRRPLLVPREQAHGEHIDDHQAQIAAELVEKGLATSRRVEELTTDDLLQAARWRVTSDADASPIELTS